MPTVEKKDKPKVGNIFDKFLEKKAKGLNSNNYNSKGQGKAKSIAAPKIATRQNLNKGNR